MTRKLIYLTRILSILILAAYSIDYINHLEYNFAGKGGDQCLWEPCIDYVFRNYVWLNFSDNLEYDSFWLYWHFGFIIIVIIEWGLSLIYKKIQPRGRKLQRSLEKDDRKAGFC